MSEENHIQCTSSYPGPYDNQLEVLCVLEPTRNLFLEDTAVLADTSDHENVLIYVRIYPRMHVCPI